MKNAKKNKNPKINNCAIEFNTLKNNIKNTRYQLKNTTYGKYDRRIHEQKQNKKAGNAYKVDNSR